MKQPDRQISTREMEGIGLSVGEANKKNLESKRAKKGECPTCGNRTHKVGFFGKRTALTIEGKCLYGRCLLCHPVEGYSLRTEEPNANVPRTIETEVYNLPDDATMVSGITMDNRLVVGARNWNRRPINEEDSGSFGDSYDSGDVPAELVATRRRPEPSVGGDSFLVAGRPPARNVSGFVSDHDSRMDQAGMDFGNAPNAQGSFRPGNEQHDRPFRENVAGTGPPPRQDDWRQDVAVGIPQASHKEFVLPGQQDMVPNEGGFRGSVSRGFNGAPAMVDVIEEDDRKVAPSVETSATKEHTFTPPRPRSPPTTLPTQQGLSPVPEQGRRRLPDGVAPLGVAAGQLSQRSIGTTISQTRSRRRAMPKKSHEDISVILNNMDHEVNRDKAFLEIAEIIFDSGHKAKTRFIEFYGMETLVESMWEDMGDASVQAAACELLLALASSKDASSKHDVLIGANAEGAVDALLFIMQTHSGVEQIQRLGCGTLCCLASASSTNERINDGTLSGAVLSVVTAMATHQASLDIQILGLRALFAQCVQSVNAESNKSTLATLNVEDSGVGVEIIAFAMETILSDITTMEYACRLYWCLSSSDEVAGVLSSTPVHVTAIMHCVTLYRESMNASSLMEAGLGALANLARLEQNHAAMLQEGVVASVISAMENFHDNEGVNTEACLLLANLAQTLAMQNEIVEADGVTAIARAMDEHDGSTELQAEAIGALCNLSVDCKLAKTALSTEAAMVSMIQILQDGESASPVQEKTCSLIASLAVNEQVAELAVEFGALDVVLELLDASSGKRKLLESASLVLRNLACHGVGLDVLLDTVAIETIVQAMSDCSESAIFQINGCCILWNLCSRAEKEMNTVADAGAIKQIVKGMQSHMDSSAVLEMACGALWSLIVSSDGRKQDVVDSEGIEAVTCALVMHPTDPGTLIMACGMLACLSTSRAVADVVAENQGIGMVVEAMRANSSSLQLLELGSMVLRNITLMNPKYASESSNGISTIVTAMNEHPDSVRLQKEACNFLWAMASQSEECKAKILALDGVTILMKALDHHSNVSDVEVAARGAILAMS